MMLGFIVGVGLFLLIISIFIKVSTKKTLSIFTIGLSIGFVAMFFLAMVGLVYGTTDTILINNLPFVHISSLESFFLLVFSIVGLSVSIYTQRYWSELFDKHKSINYYLIFLILFILSMIGVIVSNEAIFFLICWEIMSLSSYFLVIHNFQDQQSVKNANLYLIITHIGMFAILASFVPFIQHSGSTFFTTRTTHGISNLALDVMFFLALLGFGSKAGLVPTHLRLPKAHPIAPSNISALMSGFMVKLPILMIIKYLFWIQNIHFSRVLVVLILASLSGFIGIFFALVQDNIKRMLANSTIENVGIIFLGIAILMFGMYLHNNTIMYLGILASIYHIFNHAMFKTLLFLSSGGIHARTGTYNHSQLGGLLKFAPLFGIFVLIGVLAIAGVPPFNGFNSEIVVYLGLITSVIHHTGLVDGLLFVVSLFLFALTAVFSLIGFTKIFATTFLGNQRNKNLTYTKVSSSYEKVGYSFLIVGIVFLSLFPGIIQHIASGILGKTSLVLNHGGKKGFFSLQLDTLHYTPIVFWIVIAIVLIGGILLFKKFYKNTKLRVWNCGYDYVSPRTQYTPISFIQPVRKIYLQLYSAIIHTHRQHNDNVSKQQRAYYKKHLSHIEYSTLHTNVFDTIYSAITRIMQHISVSFKSLQNGRMELYVIYMLITLLIVMAIVLQT